MLRNLRASRVTVTTAAGSIVLPEHPIFWAGLANRRASSRAVSANSLRIPCPAVARDWMLPRAKAGAEEGNRTLRSCERQPSSSQSRVVARGLCPSLPTLCGALQVGRDRSEGKFTRVNSNQRWRTVAFRRVPIRRALRRT